MKSLFTDHTEEDKLLTTKEVRSRWKVSQMFLWRARQDGKLHPLKLGRGVRYKLSDILKFEAEAATR